MSTLTTPTLAIGVLDIDGLHLPGRPLVPITGAIRHVGDLYNGARRYGLTQLWLTDAWVRAVGLPDELAVAGQFRELRHAFVSDGLDDLHAFPTALTPWLDLRKKGEAGSGMSIVFSLYDEHAVWGRGHRGRDAADGAAGLRAGHGDALLPLAGPHGGGPHAGAGQARGGRGA